MASDLHIFAIPGMPEVTANIDLGRSIADAIHRSGRSIEAGDVFVVAQKIVSKAEGALVSLDDVIPSRFAVEWAGANGKEPRMIEVVLRETRRVVRMDRGILICETHHGFVCANAGVDASNVPPGFVTVLPRDPDASAARISETLTGTFGRSVATIVSDTFGRPWREGVVNVALGVAGLQPLVDCRGREDQYGRHLQTTVIAIADELAAAAELVTGKIKRMPVAVIRGAAEWSGDGDGKMLLRDAATDLFR